MEGAVLKPRKEVRDGDWIGLDRRICTKGHRLLCSSFIDKADKREANGIESETRRVSQTQRKRKKREQLKLVLIA